MSRRKRRRQQGTSRRQNRWGVWGLRLGLALLCVGFAVMGGGYLWLKSWLHSEDFRQMLSGAMGDALGGEASFGEFRWDGAGVESPTLDARGEGTLARLEARGLSMDVGLDDLGDRRVMLHHGRIEELQAVLDLTRQTVSPAKLPPAGPVAAEPWYARWIPNDFQLTELSVAHAEIDVRVAAGDIRTRGLAWDVTPAEVDGAYAATARGGRLELPWEKVPELRLERMRVRYQDGHLFVLDSDFRLYERGRASLTGEVSDGSFALNARVADIMADEVIPEDWRQRIDGHLKAEFALVKERVGPVVSGSLSLLDGVLTGLPVLDALGAYGGSPRFRRLILNEASTRFHWEQGALVLSDLRLGSDGLVRVEGAVRVGADESLDGTLRLGLTPGTLARIPGAETRVFLPGPRGLLWTVVRLGGTLDDPEEDLTERLIAAAGWRMIEQIPETGEKVFKFTRQAVPDRLLDQIEGGGKVLQRGTEVVESGRRVLTGEGDLLDEAGNAVRQGQGAVREVGGIFGIFDPPPAEEDQAEGAD